MPNPAMAHGMDLMYDAARPEPQTAQLTMAAQQAVGGRRSHPLARQPHCLKMSMFISSLTSVFSHTLNDRDRVQSPLYLLQSNATVKLRLRRIPHVSEGFNPRVQH